MNIETIITIICLLLAVIFGSLSILFALLKEKGALLISGFNTMPKEEQEKYDRKKMSIDMRNSLFRWSLILFLGAIFSYFFSKYFAIIAIFFSRVFIWIQKKPLRNIGNHKKFEKARNAVKSMFVLFLVINKKNYC